MLPFNTFLWHNFDINIELNELIKQLSLKQINMKTFIAIFALALICVSAQKNDSSSSKSRPAKPMFNPCKSQ